MDFGCYTDIKKRYVLSAHISLVFRSGTRKEYFNLRTSLALSYNFKHHDQLLHHSLFRSSIMFRNLQNVLNISDSLMRKAGVFLPIVFSSSVSIWLSRTLSDPIANQFLEKQRLNINVTLWFFSVIIDRSRLLFYPKWPLAEKNRRVNPAARALVTFMAEKFSNFLYNKRPSKLKAENYS